MRDHTARSRVRFTGVVSSRRITVRPHTVSVTPAQPGYETAARMFWRLLSHSRICKGQFLFQKSEPGKSSGCYDQAGDSQAEVLMGVPGADLQPPFFHPLSRWRKEGKVGAGRKDVHTLGRMNPAVRSVQPQLPCWPVRHLYSRSFPSLQTQCLSLVLSSTMVTLCMRC